MTRAEMESYVESRPYDPKLREIWEYVGRLETVRDAARRAIMDERDEDGGAVWFLGGQAIPLGDALAALDERQP